MKSKVQAIALATATAALAALAACASGGNHRGSSCTAEPRDSVYRASGVVYRDCAVDRTARLASTAVRPNFVPNTAGGQTCYTAEVEFVVDETGHPDGPRDPGASHERDGLRRRRRADRSVAGLRAGNEGRQDGEADHVVQTGRVRRKSCGPRRRTAAPSAWAPARLLATVPVGDLPHRRHVTERRVAAERALERRDRNRQHRAPVLGAPVQLSTM